MGLRKIVATKPAIYFDVGGVLMSDFMGDPLRASTFERVAEMVAGCNPVVAEKLFSDHWRDIDLGRVNLNDQAREMGLDPKSYEGFVESTWERFTTATANKKTN